MRIQARIQNAERGPSPPAPRSTLPTPRHSPPVTRHTSKGFTMIEIALSLAVIGFALVAILGILPIGMGLQKQNREETVVNQDASIFLDAIRNGAQGLDDLTNYVISITNTVYYHKSGLFYKAYGYTPTSLPFSINTGYRIIGLLSTPMYTPGPNGLKLRNQVVAYVRSMSGPASEKYPQKNASVQDLAFSYRLAPAISPVWQPPTSDPNSEANLQNMQNNLHELRLTFRWPLVDQTRGRIGPTQQSFRSMAAGVLEEVNEPAFPRTVPNEASPYDLYFFQPRTAAKAP